MTDGVRSVRVIDSVAEADCTSFEAVAPTETEPENIGDADNVAVGLDAVSENETA